MEVSRRHAMAALIGGLAVALHPVTDQFSQFLRLAFLRSPNYAAGVSGWTINQDGSAEFNNLTIRGFFEGTNFEINTNGAFFYSGPPAAGNLIASIATAAGTDVKGNAYLAGVTAYRTVTPVAVQLNNGNVTWSTAATEAGPWTQQGQIGDTLWTEPSASLIALQVGSPAFSQLIVQLSQIVVNTSLLLSNESTPAVPSGGPYLYGTAGQPAYENPQGLLANLSGGQLAAVNQNTVTQAVMTNLASATIPANDAEIGATYKFTAYGSGTWGSTQQQLNFGARFGATAATTAAIASIAAAALAVSAGFEWWAEVLLVCVTTGVSATWQVLIRGMVTETANPILPGTAADNSVPFSSGTIAAIPYTLDSTIAEIMGVSASWGSTTGAPTLTKTASFFERIA